MTQRSRPQQSLSRLYHDLDAELPVREDLSLAPLVVPTGNDTAAVHRWFRLKESFSHKLLSKLLAELDLPDRDLSLLDPYAGGATSLVSAATMTEEGHHRFTRIVGIERNPFLHLVAATKVRALVEHADDFDHVVSRIRGARARGELHAWPTPALSTFANRDYFPARVLNDLLRLRRAAEEFQMSDLSRDLIRVCLAATVEPVARLRRDGRALRLDQRTGSVGVMREFGRRAAAVSADVKRDKIAVDAVVHRGDGRDVVSTLGAKVKFDLAVFSPPYPNNIDYTEIYKLEAWLLGLIRSRDEFRSLRYETMRSHPSVAFPDDYPASDGPRRTEVMQLIDPLLRVVPPDRYRHARVRLIRGYFDDILQTFVGLRDVLRAGAYSVYVVGNSAHGHADGFVIAADVLIAALARLAGFEVRSMTIARRPSRRSVKSPFLRESIVVLQNPHVRSQPDSVPPKR